MTTLFLPLISSKGILFFSLTPPPMEPCMARCVFYITNEMQLIQCSLLLSALHMSGGFSAHHQELIKLHVQPWLLSCCN